MGVNVVTVWERKNDMSDNNKARKVDSHCVKVKIRGETKVW